MRKMLQVGSMLGLTLAVSASVSAQSLDGRWEGEAVLNGQPVEVSLNFSRVNGQSVGTISLTGLEGDHELFIVHYEAPILHVETAADRVLLVFDAEARGDYMRGWIEREGDRARVELIRESAGRP